MLNKLLLHIIFACAFNGLLAQNELNREFKISIILPFNSKEMLTKPNSINKALSDACREYYQGLLIALDSIAQMQNSTHVFVKIFDSKKDSLTIKNILLDNFVKESHLIIGPALKEGHIMLQQFSKQNPTVYRVSPFLTLTKSSINDSKLISYNPDLYSYADFLMNHLNSQNEKQVNLVLVKGAGKNNEIMIKRFKELENTFIDIKIQYVEINNPQKLAQSYKLDKSNMFFILSDDESQVSNTLKQLLDSTQFADVNVFGLKKWFEFKSVNAHNWRKLNVQIITPFFADYSNQEVKLFSSKYNEKYFTEPTEFAFEGYRQMMYLFYAFNKTSGKFDKLGTLSNIKILGLNNKLDYSGKSTSIGNRSLNLIRFNKNNKLELVD
jgi:hypothetical protein